MGGEGTHVEKPSEAFTPSKEMLLKLFTEEQYTQLNLEKLSEEEQARKVWEASDTVPGFAEKLKKVMDDPAEPQEFRDWLKKWMSKFAKELQGDLQEGARIMRQGVVIDVEPSKPAGDEAPAEVPAKPGEEAAKPEGALPPAEGATATPPPDGTQPPVEGQPKPAEPVKPTGPAKPKYDVAADQAKLKHIKNEDLFKTILERGTALFEGIKGIAASTFNMFAAPKLTPAQVKEVKVDLEKDKETKYVSDNRAVEYVCSALNIPVQPSAEKLLGSLKATPDFVYETDKNQFKDLKPGDVLFFQKAEKPGVPYSVGVVSKLEPLSMRIVKDAGVAQEIEINTSTEFQNEWLGFVRIPQKKEVQLPPK